MRHKNLSMQSQSKKKLLKVIKLLENKICASCVENTTTITRLIKVNQEYNNIIHF